MDKKIIEKIAWWIPIKKYRNYFRICFQEKEIDKKIEEYNNRIKLEYQIPKIQLIQIETHNRCNNDCNFCPVSVGNDKRIYKKMSEELFNKIINNLSKIDYRGQISLFDNNEPFLDNRINNFIKIAKEKLPNAFHYIMTNGLVLTLDKYKEACKYLDIFLIDNYNNDGELNPNTKIIYDFCLKNQEYLNKTIIFMRSKNEILSSRAGNAPNRQNTLKIIDYICPMPFYQFHIRPDGKISLCCNDAWGEMTLGDLSKNTIQKIWNSRKYKKIRKQILKGRENIKICKYCDYIDNIDIKDNELFEHFKNAPHNVLKDYYN